MILHTKVNSIVHHMGLTDYSIHLLTPTLLPGQMVSGNFVFTVHTEMDFSCVTLKLIGREYFSGIVTSTDGGYLQGSRKRGTVRNFFKVHMTVLGMPKWGGAWKGKLAPGTYNFPFSARLPMDVLPTMLNYELSSSHNVAVQHYVKAKIVCTYSGMSYLLYKYLKHFTVVTAMPAAQTRMQAPYTSAPTEAARSCCYCCSRGSTNFAFSIDKNMIIFGRDTVVSGNITVNNSACQDPVKDVEVALVHRVTFEKGGHSFVVQRPVVKGVIEARIPAGQQGEQTFLFQLDLGSPTFQYSSYDCHCCRMAPSPENVPYPCSFKGEFLTNTYAMVFSSNRDVLGQITVLCASAVDESNTAPPVQSDTVGGRTVSSAAYPRFLYAPPAGGTPQIPPQASDIGPFNCQPPLEPIREMY